MINGEYSGSTLLRCVAYIPSAFVSFSISKIIMVISFIEIKMGVGGFPTTLFQREGEKVVCRDDTPSPTPYMALQSWLSVW